MGGTSYGHERDARFVVPTDLDDKDIPECHEDHKTAVQRVAPGVAGVTHDLSHG